MNTYIYHSGVKGMHWHAHDMAQDPDYLHVLQNLGGTVSSGVQTVANGLEETQNQVSSNMQRQASDAVKNASDFISRASSSMLKSVNDASHVIGKNVDDFFRKLTYTYKGTSEASKNKTKEANKQGWKLAEKVSEDNTHRYKSAQKLIYNSTHSKEL